MLSALRTKPEFSLVRSFEELWNDCAQAIYGDYRPPQAARQWFLIGAASLFEILDRMAEKLDAGESDDVTGERLNQLRQHLRLACASAVPPDSLPFDGRPN